MRFPWQDRTGRLSALKLAVFAALFLPGFWTLGCYAMGELGPRPWTEVIHQTGLWAIRFLFVSLAVTPIRRILQLPQLITIRRMVGVAAFCYAGAHFLAYVGDQGFDWRDVVSEVVRRFYLTIGFAALLMLGALAATSTDGMIRRLGGKAWRRLHQLVYLIGVLTLTHYFIQTKLGFGEPLTMAGIFAWLMIWRLLVALRPAWATRTWTLALLALAAGFGAALAEAIYIWISLGVDPRRVLAAAFAGIPGSRAGWIITIAGLLIALAALLRARLAPQRRRAIAA